MFKTGPNYTGFSPSLTECLLNKTVTEGTTKKIDEATLDEATRDVALAIVKARYADMKTRFEINAADKNISLEDAEKASDLDKRIANYTANLEDIFEKCKLSPEQGYNLLHNMQDDQLFLN
jgi:hypothetical protein